MPTCPSSVPAPRSSRLLALATLLALGVATAACNNTKPGVTEKFPFRDAWRTEIDTDFPYLDGDGKAQITSILIGGRTFSDNFANRGDVVVKFTGPDNRIKVEVRRFAFAPDVDGAKAEFDKLWLWAYAESPTSPKPPKPDDDSLEPPPDPADESLNCENGWMDGCGIRMYYYGQAQPSRAGADIRVTLPASYRHKVDIVTEDNAFDDDYLDRGNVCVENANQSALSTTTESGRVYILTSPDLTPGPLCTQTQIEACETWTDDNDNPAAWDPQCPCQSFGSLNLSTFDAGAANITADIPATLWASMNLKNDDSPEAAGDCTATIDPALNPEIDPTTADVPYKTRGEINHPSDAAIQGGGFNIQMSSAQCAVIAYTEDPNDYVGKDNSADQPEEVRGNLEVCSGCLSGMSCEDLLPWTK